MSVRNLIWLLLAVPVLAQEPTIVLNGTSYTMQPHPRVFFNAALFARSCSTSGLAAKAVSTNPAYVGLAARAASELATYGQPSSTHNYDSTYNDGSLAADYAAWFCADPSQTAAQTAALYLLNNVQQYVPLICNEAIANCINSHTGYDVTSYGPAYWMPNWILTYELMRPSMTTTQRETFTDKMLNDIVLWGGTGLGGGSSTPCTNPSIVGSTSVTISSSGVITASAPYFGSGQTLQVGDWVMQNGLTATIASITDSEHATLESDQWSAFSGYSGTLLTRTGAWTNGQCGWFWVAKHNFYTVWYLINSTTAYPSPNGFGSYGGIDAQLDPTFNLVLSSIYGMTATLYSVADDDVNYSARGSVEITALYNGWHSAIFNGLNEYNYTGFTPTGSAYGIWRAYTFYPLTAFAIQNSVVSGPSLLPSTGYWARNMSHHFYMATFPSCPALEQEYGQSSSSLSGDPLNNYIPNSYGLTALITMFQGTPDGEALNYWAQNLWQTCPNGSVSGNTPGTNLIWTNSNMSSSEWVGSWVHWPYLYMDSAYPTNPTLPTGSVDNCSDAGCSGSVPTTTSLPMAGMISRTGYSSITDTLVNFYQIATNEIDHTNTANGLGQPGDIRIFKGGELMADDYGGYNNGGPAASVVSIGADTDFADIPYTGLMPAGANDSSNRYTYALTDSTASYTSGAGVTGALRYVVHFKKSGTQDFIVVYDYVKTSAAKQVIDYWHYTNPTTTTFSSPTVTSSFAGTGHSDATQLLTKFLQPAGSNTTYAYTNNSNGTYTGGNGYTYRVSVCGSSSGSSCATTTTAEYATVHEPVAGSGNSLPALEMLTTIDGNHRGIEVDGAGPKVFIVPIGTGEPTFTGATFTTAVPGTAQFLVAGLTAGTYSVTIAGVTVVSGAAVTAGNNTLYFEGGSGAVVVSSSGGTTYTLSSATSGAGTGTVSCTPPAGAAYSAGTSISCSCTPTGGSSLTSCSGCSFTGSGGTISGAMPASACTVTGAFAAGAALSLGAGTCPVAGTQGTAYAGCSLAASGGTPPYTYTWVSSAGGPTFVPYAALPEGLNLSSAGAISGTISGQGGYTVEFKVTDAASNTATTSVTFAIAGNNAFAQQIFPSTSIFHHRVDASSTSLPVDTSPAAAVNSSYTGTALKVFFGANPSSNSPNGIPMLQVPSTQTNQAFTFYASYNYPYFTTAPYPQSAPIESSVNNCPNPPNQDATGDDCHVLIAQLNSSSVVTGLYETWNNYPTGTAWRASTSAYWPNVQTNTMVGQGQGTSDAAGLPVAPLLLTADEVLGTGTGTSPNGTVRHPVRFTVTNPLRRYVWPATTKSGSSSSCTGGYSDTNGQLMQANPPASCTTTMPYGEIYRLKSSVTNPSCAATSPQAAIIITGLRNYGIIVADGGQTGGLIGTPDSRWNDSDLACLTNFTLGNFEPVNVSSLIPSGNLPSGCPATSGDCVTLASYQTSATTYALTATTSGSGTGTLTGASCAGSYIAGTGYSCTATPGALSYLSSLSDTCGGTVVGNVDSGTMPSNACAVTAVFTLSATSGHVMASGALSGSVLQ